MKKQNKDKITTTTEIIIGQEAICPDGLGRIAKVEHGVCQTVNITVDTYIKNRSCCWDSTNITLINVGSV